MHKLTSKYYDDHRNIRNLFNVKSSFHRKRKSCLQAMDKIIVGLYKNNIIVEQNSKYLEKLGTWMGENMQNIYLTT